MRYTIKTKRLLLRPYRGEDEEALVRNINSKKVYRATLHIPYPYTVQDAKQWIAKNRKLAKQKNPESVNFVIEMNGELIGGIGFDDVEKNHRAEIGYWLGEKYWGQGIITEAVRAVTKFGFEELHLHRIYACVYPFNKASMKVLKKSGYKLEGLIRKNVMKNGKLLNDYQFAKVK
ncbi:MAG: hypothetical protein A2940_00035 [Candidatus Wildermuthbacteria bacterium RIFCSPLOWO2_01_FULL_48_29]|uniref:N-acetyltransferase domain-containing protein n=2 Tax=Candidatus Wildermuthiibacteriota TaxID=1817923 RepID=A0A1G2RMG5_9BACT|nr:MAG: hypothetical protein A2843_02500 [Candidatus Wildermuthbacteria bacterium RIFCSPHIGHO2_01_FULL_48_27b]OHA74034.1 MAG: hypothetical protein A2940_00035 [Candidatus Wildermuthbacteria bacterium RIFCSPLOWO2_01_FULL_48_29]